MKRLQTADSRLARGGRHAEAELPLSASRPRGRVSPRRKQGAVSKVGAWLKRKTARQVTNHAPYSIVDSIFLSAARAPAPLSSSRDSTNHPADPHHRYGPAPRSSCCPAARRLPTRREPRSSDLMPRRGSCTGRPQPRACRPRPSAPGSAATPAPSNRSAWVRTRWQVRKQGVRMGVQWAAGVRVRVRVRVRARGRVRVRVRVRGPLVASEHRLASSWSKTRANAQRREGACTRLLRPVVYPSPSP